MRNKYDKYAALIGIVAIIALVILLGVSCNEENTPVKQNKSVAITANESSEKSEELAAIETTTTTNVPRETSTVYVTNPADAETQAKLDQCRAALDKYAAAVETMRQTIRTYDDAAMTDNQELADIALNTNALSVIPGLVADYENCY